MSPKVSIILPVYNAGEYLAPCLDSLLAQTLRDIEIIVVLDCPTDGSDRVAEDYARRDSRIVLLKNDRNLNISLSRNRGLDVARGEYIGFSDHDDYCAPDMYEEMLNAIMSHNADIAICDLYEKRNGQLLRNSYPKEKLDFNASEYLLARIIAASSVPVWRQLYKRQTIGDLRFVDKVSFEDALFNAMLYEGCPSIVYVPQTYYVHVWHGKNTFTTSEYRTLQMTTAYLKKLIGSLRSVGLLDKYETELADGCFRRLYSSFLAELRKNPMVILSKINRYIRSDEELSTYIAMHKKYPYLKKRYTISKRLFLFLLA